MSEQHEEERKVQLYATLPTPLRVAIHELRDWVRARERGMDEVAAEQLVTLKAAALALLGWEGRALKARDNDAQLESTRRLHKRSQTMHKPRLRLVPKDE